MRNFYESAPAEDGYKLRCPFCDAVICDDQGNEDRCEHVTELFTSYNWGELEGLSDNLEDAVRAAEVKANSAETPEEVDMSDVSEESILSAIKSIYRGSQFGLLQLSIGEDIGPESSLGTLYLVIDSKGGEFPKDYAFIAGDEDEGETKDEDEGNE